MKPPGYALLALLLVSLGLPPMGGAQVPIRPTPDRMGPVAPNVRAELLRKQAEQLRLKAYDLTAAAEDRRDNNKDGAADELDGRAENLLGRARSLDEQARHIELGGGRHPGRVSIPAF